MAKRKPTENITVPEKITVHNKISSNFRELHVDGAYGGVTPRGLINLNFYAERFPIPKSSDFRVNEEMTGLELVGNSDDSKTGIIREYEIGIYIDLGVAKGLVEFLESHIDELENLKKQKENVSSTKK